MNLVGKILTALVYSCIGFTMTSLALAAMGQPIKLLFPLLSMLASFLIVLRGEVRERE